MKNYEVEKMEKNLTLINKNGALFVDSREVAEMIGKQHAHLCRDIQNYINVFGNNPKLDSSNFFIESSYKQAGNGKEVKCYLLTKKGCDMVANKLTGEKGILFTANYINAFYEMEQELKATQNIPSYQIEDSIERAKAWIIEEKQRRELKQQNTKLITDNKALANENDILTDYVKDCDLINTGVIAQNHGMTTQALNKLLHEKGIQYKPVNAKCWHLYKKYEDADKYARIVIERNCGYTYPCLKWTPDGVILIESVLRSEVI